MNSRNSAYWLSVALVIIGGVNWGLVGIFNFNIVTALFGSSEIVNRLVYFMVGIAALNLAIEFWLKPHKI